MDLYRVRQGVTVDKHLEALGVKSLPENVLSRKIVDALNAGGKSTDVKIDIEKDFPESNISDFLIRSRKMRGFAVALAGSSIRDILMGTIDGLGDIDLALGPSDGRNFVGMHQELYDKKIAESRALYEGGKNNLVEKIHLSSPHTLRKLGDGRWIYRKKTRRSQYTTDYIGLMNTGEVIDPYEGIKDLYGGKIILDFLNPRFKVDNPNDIPGAPAFAKDIAVDFETVVRGLFSRYKWGASFSRESEAELIDNKPDFSCGNYELTLLKRLCVWVNSPIELMGDLKRYKIIQSLKEKYQSREKVRVLSEQEKNLETFLRSGGKPQGEVEVGGFVEADKVIDEFLKTLEPRFAKPLKHEISK